MFYVYVLKSVKQNYIYKGHCEDLDKRLKEHNSGMTFSTKPYIPFEVIYFEEFETREQAIQREQYFKSSAGRRFLKSKISL